MKASDYIVEYLIEKGITDVFGYPGGMVTHLMDSFQKYEKDICAHVTYHEQGAAFAACGYAQASNKIGVAYATSGPGATNLITGICNAYFDSIPVLCITGQVNTFEQKGQYQVRQRGFQETDIVSMVQSTTKYAVKIDDAKTLKWHLDYACHMAMEGRKGPVLLDIPMNIFRAEIEPEHLEGFAPESISDNQKTDGVEIKKIFETELCNAKRPVLLVGNGVKIANQTELLQDFLAKTSVPVVTTMLAVDAVSDYQNNYGFIGAYGSRVANFAVAKSDLVIALGARLDVRQVGAKRENFAPDSRLIRVDIDAGELSYKVHCDEISICADVKDVLNILIKIASSTEQAVEYEKWIRMCDYMKQKLAQIDDRLPNSLARAIGKSIPEGAVITTDVGQNQVWVAQSLQIKEKQKVFFSGGHGAMGYSLPAAIGCCIHTKHPVYSFNGDGGLQMNIQELMTIARERIPVKIILFNNQALGMIRHFQEMYFENRFFQTVSEGGYDTPDFGAIANAYQIPYVCVQSSEDIQNMNAEIWTNDKPAFIEIAITENTYVFPKLEFGKPNQDQEPLLDRKLYNELMALTEENV